MVIDDYFIAPSKTKAPLTDPTSFPTVIPDPPIYQEAGAAGVKTLWVVFVLMLIATITFGAMAWSVPVSKRIYHSITTLIVLIATISYFAMATGTGFTLRHFRWRDHHEHGVPDTFRHIHREVYWVRYVDWLLTTPLILVDLTLLAGLNGSNLFSMIIANNVMVLSGLFSALTPSSTWSIQKDPIQRLPSRGARWGWYAIGCIAFLYIAYTILVTGISVARKKGSAVSRVYTSIATYTLVIWIAYPIIWGISASSHRLTVDGEIVAYGILDILAKGIFGAWLLYAHHRIPETHVTVGGFWSHGVNSEGHIRVGEDDEGA